MPCVVKGRCGGSRKGYSAGWQHNLTSAIRINKLKIKQPKGKFSTIAGKGSAIAEHKIKEQRNCGASLHWPSWGYSQLNVLVSCNISSPSPQPLPLHIHAYAYSRHWGSCGPLPEGVGLRCQGAAETSRSWSQKPSKGQYLTAEPGSWFCSLSIVWAILCQKSPVVDLPQAQHSEEHDIDLGPCAPAKERFCHLNCSVSHLSIQWELGPRSQAFRRKKIVLMGCTFPL